MSRKYLKTNVLLSSIAFKQFFSCGARSSKWSAQTTVLPGTFLVSFLSADYSWALLIRGCKIAFWWRLQEILFVGEDLIKNLFVIMQAQFVPGFFVWYNCGPKFEGGTQWKTSGETFLVSFAACPSKQLGPVSRTHYPIQKIGSVCQQPCSNLKVLGQLSPLTWWPKFEERLQFSDGVDCDRGSETVQQWYAQGAGKCIDLDPWFSEDLHHMVAFLFYRKNTRKAFKPTTFADQPFRSTRKLVRWQGS